MLENVPAALRDELLRFYLALDESLPLQDCLRLLLEASAASLAPHRLVVVVPLVENWLALTSSGVVYRGPERPASAFGQPDSSQALVIQPIGYPNMAEKGWICLYGAGADEPKASSPAGPTWLNSWSIEPAIRSDIILTRRLWKRPWTRLSKSIPRARFTCSILERLVCLATVPTRCWERTSTF